MIGSLISKIFGNKSAKDIKRIYPKIHEINNYYTSLNSLSDKELVTRYKDLKIALASKINEKKTSLGAEGYESLEIDEKLHELETDFLDKNLCLVFAIVKDVARRLCGQDIIVMNQKLDWNMIHYDEQLIGGIVLHQGKVAEMKTGEGKTLVSTLPIVLNALTGRGVHVITVNDYLAERDSQWMGYIYKFLNLSVGCNQSQMSNESRRDVYSCDITYGTNSTFGFDYLRDNMTFKSEHQVQKSHVFAIIDEVDSVLIDESRTPLIISGEVDQPSNQKYNNWRSQIERLIKKQNNLVNELVGESEILLDTDRNKAGVKLLQASRGAPRHKKLIKILQQSGVKQLCYQIESEYLRDKKMNEIDDELYFIIEEKSNIVDLSDKGRNELSPDSPDDFIIPDLGEIFHSLDNSDLDPQEVMLKKDEAQLLHSKRSDQIHTINQLLRAFSLFFKDEEYIVKDGKVQIVDEHTGRIMHGRRYSDGLHQALESKEKVRIEKETQTVATITIQNYFRMYEKLAGMTGTAVTEAPELMEIYKLDVVEIPTHRPVVRKDLDDMIYKTKREKYNACIDKIRELFHKGQPVLVGTTSVEESETLSRLLRKTKIPHNVLNAKQHQNEADIVARAGQKNAVTISTNMAGRGTDIKLGSGVEELGGLFILGTGRHESRRIDLQLRGRAGRQGDAGESIFYLSLEDNLMRLFGSERISKVMDRLGLEEGEVITHSMVSKSIERAQRKIEGRNFSMRKNLIEYDDVMNNQRSVVYDRRNEALSGNSVRNEVENIINEHIEYLIETYCNNEWDIEQLSDNLLSILSIEYNNLENTETTENLKKSIIDKAREILNMKEDFVQATFFEEFQKFILFKTIDQKWKEHLYSMDQLREGINFRAYGQKNPLVEYKQEGYTMFTQMMIDTNEETLKRIFRSNITFEKDKSASTSPSNINLSHNKMPSSFMNQAPTNESSKIKSPIKFSQKPISATKKYGRNDKVKISDGSITKELKFKKAESLIEQGWTIIEK